MISFLFMMLIAVPAAALIWRAVMSKQRTVLRAAAAATAMLTLVGAVSIPRIVFGENDTYSLMTVRDGLALLAAASGSVFLLLWAGKNRGRGKSKTISIIAAVIGLVPIAATVATALMYAGDH